MSDFDIADPTAVSVARYPLDGLLADIGDVPFSSDPSEIRRKSRDYYWYSPIFNAQLKDKRADLIVSPRDEADVIRVARACFRHRIPLTVRGGATGNYGQCVPLEGGVVLDMAAMDRIAWQKPGVVRVQAGARLFDIDRQTRPNGWELRMHPSVRLP